jgi:hypothetical protein
VFLGSYTWAFFFWWLGVSMATWPFSFGRWVSPYLPGHIHTTIRVRKLIVFLCAFFSLSNKLFLPDSATHLRVSRGTSLLADFPLLTSVSWVAWRECQLLAKSLPIRAHPFYQLISGLNYCCLNCSGVIIVVSIYGGASF